MYNLAASLSHDFSFFTTALRTALPSSPASSKTSDFERRLCRRTDLVVVRWWVYFCTDLLARAWELGTSWSRGEVEGDVRYRSCKRPARRCTSCRSRKGCRNHPLSLAVWCLVDVVVVMGVWTSVTCWIAEWFACGEEDWHYKNEKQPSYNEPPPARAEEVRELCGGACRCVDKAGWPRPARTPLELSSLPQKALSLQMQRA